MSSWASQAGSGSGNSGGNVDTNYIETVTGDTTLDATHHTVLVDASAGNVLISLPSAASAYSSGVGRVYNVKKIDSSSNTVTVDGDGSEMIDGYLTRVLTDNQLQTLTIQSDGTGWRIL